MTRQEQIIQSKGYQVLLKSLNHYFGKDYVIRDMIIDSDVTSFDFQFIVDFPKLKGADIGIIGSGPSQMFRVSGNGCISIALPQKSAYGILPTGQKGDSLARILNNKDIRWGADVDNPIKIDRYFKLFIDYYQKNY